MIFDNRVVILSNYVTDALDNELRYWGERGAYNCQVIIDEQCTKDAKRKYREILEELGYSVEVERHLETDDWGQGYYNISLKIRWD